MSALLIDKLVDQALVARISEGDTRVIAQKVSKDSMLGPQVVSILMNVVDHRVLAMKSA